jgi:hypothetical protein
LGVYSSSSSNESVLLGKQDLLSEAPSPLSHEGRGEQATKLEVDPRLDSRIKVN